MMCEAFICIFLQIEELTDIYSFVIQTVGAKWRD